MVVLFVNYFIFLFLIWSSSPMKLNLQTFLEPGMCITCAFYYVFNPLGLYIKLFSLFWFNLGNMIVIWEWINRQLLHKNYTILAVAEATVEVGGSGRGIWDWGIDWGELSSGWREKASEGQIAKPRGSFCPDLASSHRLLLERLLHGNPCHSISLSTFVLLVSCPARLGHSPPGAGLHGRGIGCWRNLAWVFHAA